MQALGPLKTRETWAQWPGWHGGAVRAARGALGWAVCGQFFPPPLQGPGGALAGSVQTPVVLCLATRVSAPAFYHEVSGATRFVAPAGGALCAVYGICVLEGNSTVCDKIQFRSSAPLPAGPNDGRESL